MKRHKTDQKAFCAAWKRAGITRREAAGRIGMAENSLSRKILGQREILLCEAASLCNLLNMEDPAGVFRLK